MSDNNTDSIIHQAKQSEGRLSESTAAPFEQVLQARLSRRDALRGGLGLAVGTFFAGAGLSACGGGDSDDDDGSGSTDAGTSLGFQSIAGTDADTVTIPDDYEFQVLIPWGTPILGGYPAFDPSGATTNTAAEQAEQIGTNHDGMHFFPMSDGSPERGLLCLNHEYSNRDTLYGNAGRTEDEDGLPTVAEEVRKDLTAHGVSVVELIRSADGRWTPGNTGFNRRITLYTPMTMSGPAAGSALLQTAYDPTGMTTRGTVNNCGSGRAPWGTYLTCEENIQGYFVTREDPVPEGKARYGINAFGFGYGWQNVAGDPSETADEFTRFDTTPTGASASDDYRNEANNFGWIVEVDPNRPGANPVKRTAMGRFRHEGAAASIATDGKPLAFYMGDDARGEYFYKFVTADDWDSANPPADMLDRGTLYVARFNSDGSGEWLALDINANADLQAAFTSQAEVLVYTRRAADIVGATTMDRPEWSTVDPNTGDVYLTLTNNTDRGAEGEEQPNAANPRPDNTHGHIIRMSETDAEPGATGFTWDIFVFGSNAGAPDEFNRSGLTLANEFGGPDGLWMDPRGVLWIETDNGAPLDSGTNDQVLAVVPAGLDGDPVVRPDNQGDLRRFLVGPKGCEVTGIDMTPDYRTLFINVQHPGETFPGGAGTIPRSATIAIRRRDGGEIAL